MALDVDDPALVDEVVALQNTALAVDAPWVCEVTAESLVGWVRHGWDLEPGEHVVGLRGDRVVAVGAVYTSQWDNPDRAFLEALVHPDVRRQGAGSALLEHLTARARELGRCKLGAAAWDRSAGTPFLDRHGYAVGSRAIQRRQHVAEVPLDQVETLCRDASEAAAGYELLRWVGETPEALLDSVATMTSAINDAPLDDLDVEDEVYPPQRIRDYETATRLRGQRAYRLLARHRESGELAGHTVVAVESWRPEVAYQHDTAVVRAHRGHRLGLLLKSEMFRWLTQAEPAVRTVDTWNAESNDHMIGVNELLGYRWMGRELEYQRTVRAS